MKTQYVVRFWNHGQIEEYPAGFSIGEARKEAAFFRANVSADKEIKICKLKDERPYLVEIA
mgnify:CR=1 FL=1